MEQPRAAPWPPHCPAQLGHSTGVAVPGVAVTGVAVPGVAVTGVAVPVMFLLLRTCGWKEQRDPKSSMAGSGSGSAAAVRLGDLHSTDGSPGISKHPPCRAAEGSVAPRSCRREAELARQARAHRARHGTARPGQPWGQPRRGTGGSGPAGKEGLPQGLEGMTCERRRELNLHGGGASCLQGDVITGYKYLQGNNGDRDGELFTGARWQGTERARPGRRELEPGDTPRSPHLGQPGPGHPEICPAGAARAGTPLCPELLGGGVRVPGG